MPIPQIVENLLSRGIEILCPHSVEIGSEINPDRLSGKNVRLHAGCRLRGSQTYIAQGACIGTEGPVTIDNCYIGPNVELKSGYFKNAVFLEGASLGYGSHVREGTILEEQASTAHCVGLKQTILMPFLTLGSLINFCDCLMAGGTSRKDHSEVGSSFIHFNFTPNQDKATPSLIGDVPHGVMLDQPPIFLGGQGGLVGPCRLAFGTVSAAGTIVRKDQLKPDHLIFGGTGKGGTIPYKSGALGSSNRILKNNLLYIGNMLALHEWYVHVRRLFVSESFPEPLFLGLLDTLEIGLKERFKRLCEYVRKFDKKKNYGEHYERFQERVRKPGRELGDLKTRDAFLEDVTRHRASQAGYIDTLPTLPFQTRLTGTQWLQSIVDTVVAAGDGLMNPSD
jgi:bifunctional UDP-N-acetylglucosamine pyrophosphorylase / glucosamine-1-phosphate N-acetyltransferase